MRKLTTSWESWWSHQEWEGLFSLTSPADAFVLAERILQRMEKDGRPIGLVCGAISHPDINQVERNFNVFKKAIGRLTFGGHLIFGQIGFEDFFCLWGENWEEENPGVYPMPILEEFYEPIIERFIGYQCFLPSWENSTGAKWERERAQKHHGQIFDLTDSHELADPIAFKRFLETLESL